MATPIITFNSSTGSDTQASGCALPATAVFGTSGAYTGSVWTLDGSPDLSAVATDGTGVIWVLTSTGRQWFTINTVDNGLKTVTVDDAPAGTATGRTWAIGGKRATLDATTSRLLLTTDFKSGWIAQTETTQTLTSTQILLKSAGDSTTGPCVLRGSGGVMTITRADNATLLQRNGGSWRFINLKLQNTGATKTAAIGLGGGAATTTSCVNCTFGDVTNTLLRGIRDGATNSPTTLIDCDVVSCTLAGIEYEGGQRLAIRNCRFKGTTGPGLKVSGTAFLTIADCLFVGNTTNGILISGAVQELIIQRSVIHGNGTDGIDLSTAGTNSADAVIVSNNITGNGTTGAGYGIKGHALTNTVKTLIDYNNFGAGALVNHDGSMLNITAGTHDQAINPGYAAASTDNYAVGQALWGKGYPDATRTIGNNNSATSTTVAIGASQPASASAVRQPRFRIGTGS